MSDTNSTSDGPRTAELAEQIVNAIQYPDERVHFIRQALQLVPDEHPMAGSIRAELEFALRLINEVGDDPAHGDVTNHLRGAYGDLPLGPDDVGSTASGGEDGQDGPEAVTDGGEAVTADDGDEGGSALEEPPEDVRWQGENNERAVVELELTRPLVEWIELEANENDFDGVTDWIETQIQVALQRDLLENHDIRREVEVDLPLEFVARMRYYENDLRQRGNQTSFEDIAVNHVQLDRTYLLDGEPLGSDRLEDEDDPEPVADGGVSDEARELADAIGYDAESLQAAAEAVGESPGEFVRTAVRFRDGAHNMAEFRQYVPEEDVADEFVDA